jgi:hypothetical protein
MNECITCQVYSPSSIFSTEFLSQGKVNTYYQQLSNKGTPCNMLFLIKILPMVHFRMINTASDSDIFWQHFKLVAQTQQNVQLEPFYLSLYLIL